MMKRLLIVEDEPSLLQAIAVCLRAEGYEVVTARDGAEALARVIESLLDAIIIDIRMPGMDGYKLARNLRSNPRTALIPIIFLTSRDETSDRVEGFRSGVDAYLTKPFEPDELTAVVQNIFNRIERTRAEFARFVGQPQEEREMTLIDEALTEAELRIAQTVARGLSNKEVAAEFGLSVRTVENHISRILAKKNFSNRVEIARFVFEKMQDG